MRRRSWKAWKALSDLERRVTVSALWNSIGVATRLRVRGYRFTRQWAEHTKGISPAGSISTAEVERAAVGVFRRLPWSPNCLERSLIIARLSRLYGESPTFRLGVRRYAGALQFHAWVEVDGAVIGDRGDIAQLFTPFGGEDLPRGAVVV